MGSEEDRSGPLARDNGGASDDSDDNDQMENEETIHERLHREGRKHTPGSVGFDPTEVRARSPPIVPIALASDVTRALSMKAPSLIASREVLTSGKHPCNQGNTSNDTNNNLIHKNQLRPPQSAADKRVANSVSVSTTPSSQSRSISRKQLEYGPLLKSNEIQVLYRSPDADSSSSFDRHLKEEQAKQVAPGLRQSPVALMSINPAYEPISRPLVLDYPATVDNLRLNNTGFSWEVKLPYQISMSAALHGAHLSQTHRFRLDRFHCHWGSSEHTIDSRSYAAELHFVHYNMEKYHTLSKAARHPDGLAVLSVFVDAQENYNNHAELEKIVTHLKTIQLKGEHSIIRQAVRIENLLPANRSYWSYQGSLTTAPFFESVTWFVLKYPIRCNMQQVEKFKSLRSSVRRDDEQAVIHSNFRKTQPLNGRTVINFDEPMTSSCHKVHDFVQRKSNPRAADT